MPDSTGWGGQAVTPDATGATTYGSSAAPRATYGTPAPEAPATTGGWTADPRRTDSPTTGGWTADPRRADPPTTGGWVADSRRTDSPTTGGWTADPSTTGTRRAPVDPATTGGWAGARGSGPVYGGSGAAASGRTNAEDGAWADGVGAGQANLPETGRWSSDGRFIPQQRDGEEADFSIGRFDDTSIRSREVSPGYGRVLDHGDVADSLGTTRGAGGRSKPSLSDRLALGSGGRQAPDGSDPRGSGRSGDGEPWSTWAADADPYWGGADIPQSPYPAPPTRPGPRPPTIRPGYRDDDPRDRDYRDRDYRGRGYGEPPRRELGYRDGYPDDQYRDRPYRDAPYREYDRDARYRDPGYGEPRYGDPRYGETGYRNPPRPDDDPRGYRDSRQAPGYDGYRGDPRYQEGYGRPALSGAPGSGTPYGDVPLPTSGAYPRSGNTGTMAAVAAAPPAIGPATEAKPDETDEDDEEDGGEATTFPAVTLATICWYVVPAIVYVIWALFLTHSAPASTPGCVSTAGATCVSHAEGLSKLIAVLPQIGVALVISIIVALLLRLVTTAWRGMTVGFASAVVGAGVATVLFSVVGH